MTRKRRNAGYIALQNFVLEARSAYNTQADKAEAAKAAVDAAEMALHRYEMALEKAKPIAVSKKKEAVA